MTISSQLELGHCEIALANLYYVAKRTAEAEKANRFAISYFEKLSTDDPTNPAYRNLLGDSVGTHAAYLAASGRDDEALQAYRRTAAILETLANDFPERKARGYLLGAYFFLIQALSDPVEIAQLGRKGIDLGEQLVREYPTGPEYQRNLTVFHLATGQLIRKAEPEQARTHFERAYGIWEKVVADSPDDPLYVGALAQTSVFTALNYAAGPPDDPRFNPYLALQRARRAVELKPSDSDAQLVLGYAQYRVGDFAGCIANITKVVAAKGGDCFDNFFLAMAYGQSGNEVLARERFTQAEGLLDVEWDPTQYPDLATAHLIRDEAATLLGLTPAAVEPAPDPAANVEAAAESSKSAPVPEAAKEEEKSK